MENPNYRELDVFRNRKCIRASRPSTAAAAAVAAAAAQEPTDREDFHVLEQYTDSKIRNVFNIHRWTSKAASSILYIPPRSSVSFSVFNRQSTLKSQMLNDLAVASHRIASVIQLARQLSNISGN